MKTISNLFSWARVLKWGRKREKQRKRRLGIGAITIRFTVRGWNAILTERHSGKTEQVTNWSVSSFKGKLKFFRFEVVKYETDSSFQKKDWNKINSYFVYFAYRKQSLLILERLSKTFTANGKRQKWNFCRLSSALCTVKSKYLYLLWIVRDTFLFLCDSFKDYKKRIENQR